MSQTRGKSPKLEKSSRRQPGSMRAGPSGRWASKPHGVEEEEDKFIAPVGEFRPHMIPHMICGILGQTSETILQYGIQLIMLEWDEKLSRISFEDSLFRLDMSDRTNLWCRKAGFSKPAEGQRYWVLSIAHLGDLIECTKYLDEIIKNYYQFKSIRLGPSSKKKVYFLTDKEINILRLSKEEFKTNFVYDDRILDAVRIASGATLLAPILRVHSELRPEDFP
jgi:hypothetical protein